MSADLHARKIADLLLEERLRISRLPKERQEQPHETDKLKRAEAERQIEDLLVDYKHALALEVLAATKD